MGVLVQCYQNASHWSTRTQISLQLSKRGSLIFPDIGTISRGTIILLHGRGSTVPLVENRRMKVMKVITSQYVMQDLPFGEETLKLFFNTEIKVPNVVRTIVPELIVQQYQSYCQETGFVPMSRTTLCRILKVCSASVRKSLQGLDYVSAEGAKAFEELADVMEKLGDSPHVRGLSWAKDQSEKLKMAKRYVKSDFKVGLHIHYNIKNSNVSVYILVLIFFFEFSSVTLKKKVF